tara:strand:- start:25 stop:240 length:216 start_codon:yes stop_codon:yes gene_type:complete
VLSLDIRDRDNKEINDKPDAKPSKPSIKLKALIIESIKNKVITIENISFSIIKSNEIDWPDNRINKRHAII